MRRVKLLIFAAVFFTAASAFAGETTILLGNDYFPTVNSAIQNAKESICVAIYLINVSPAPDNTNPASILLESLISAKQRGVSIKVVLDDSMSNINHNAYNRLKQAGIDVSLDSPLALLHGKGIIIDSRLCIIGSFNWTSAALRSNYEFAVCVDDPQQAKKLLEYISNIPLSREPPAEPSGHAQGLKLPVSLFTGPSQPLLFRVFTDGSQQAFDLYLYLAKKAQNQGSPVIKINTREFAQAIGYPAGYDFYLARALDKLSRKFGLIRYQPGAKRLDGKELTLVTFPSSQYITVPDTYWEYDFSRKLSLAAKYMFLISLNEAQNSGRNPYWFRSYEDLSRSYYLCEASITNGINELEKENILEIYRDKPDKPGEFARRQANDYRLNPLPQPRQLELKLQALSRKYGPDIVRKARKLSKQLNEPNDTEKIETYIELINAYGYERVEEANSRVASYRRELGFRNISQVIALLGKGK
jgi:hypothetical protein